MEISDRINYAARVEEFLQDGISKIVSIQLIGREIPNIFLFKVSFGSGRFQIIYYDEHADKMESIFEEYNQNYNVLSGTINPEKTLLFFVTAAPDRRKLNITRYRSYLSYIGSVTNVCKLTSRFLYTQFQLITPNAPCSGDKSLYLLVMVHPLSIELNIIPREIRDSRLAISGKGEFLSISKNFLWAQWDAINNRLFTISSKGDDDLSDISTILCIQQFVVDPNKGADFITLGVFEISSIPFPKNIYCDRVSDLQYDSTRYPASHVLSDTTMNVVALWHANGSLCLCIQRPSWLSRVQFPSYKIFILHHNKAMFSILEPRQSDGEMEQPCIIFLVLNSNTILALTPFFIHVIQINRTTRVCLSTLLPKIDNEMLTLEEMSGWASIPTSTHHKAFFYSKNSNILFTLEPNLESLLTALENASSTLTRALIFHYLIANYREIEVHRRLLNSILKDLCDPEIQLFLHEYLVASIFQQFARRTNSIHLRLVQHSTLNEDIIQTHAFGRDDRSLVVKITVGNLESSLVMSLATRNVKDTFIQNLHQQISQQHRIGSRTTIEKFIPSLLNFADSQATSQPQSSVDDLRSDNPTFFERLRESLSLRRNTKASKPQTNGLSLAPPSAQTENILGQLPRFLSNPLYTAQELKPLRTSFTHFLRTHINDSTLDNYCDSLVNDYLHCVMFQIRQLLHMIWSITMNCDNSNTSLFSDETVSREDWDCFQVLETAIICFKSNAFPVPINVEDVYARLAFRLLDLRTLVQYLDCDVLTITETFAADVMDMESGVGNQCTEVELFNLKKDIVVRFSKSVQVEKLLPKCKNLLDFFYRTDHEYRNLLQSKLPIYMDGLLSESTSLSEWEKEK